MTVLEPLVDVRPCDRHADLIAGVRYTVPQLVEECADCEVGR